jgi:hypothetical protein
MRVGTTGEGKNGGNRKRRAGGGTEMRKVWNNEIKQERRTEKRKNKTGKNSERQCAFHYAKKRGNVL